MTKKLWNASYHLCSFEEEEEEAEMMMRMMKKMMMNCVDFVSHLGWIRYRTPVIIDGSSIPVGQLQLNFSPHLVTKATPIH